MTPTQTTTATRFLRANILPVMRAYIGERPPDPNRKPVAQAQGPLDEQELATLRVGTQRLLRDTAASLRQWRFTGDPRIPAATADTLHADRPLRVDELLDLAMGLQALGQPAPPPAVARELQAQRLRAQALANDTERLRLARVALDRGQPLAGLQATPLAPETRAQPRTTEVAVHTHRYAGLSTLEATDPVDPLLPPSLLEQYASNAVGDTGQGGFFQLIGQLLGDIGTALIAALRAWLCAFAEAVAVAAGCVDGEVNWDNIWTKLMDLALEAACAALLAIPKALCPEPAPPPAPTPCPTPTLATPSVGDLPCNFAVENSAS